MNTGAITTETDGVYSTDTMRPGTRVNIAMTGGTKEQHKLITYYVKDVTDEISSHFNRALSSSSMTCSGSSTHGSSGPGTPPPPHSNTSGSSSSDLLQGQPPLSSQEKEDEEDSEEEKEACQVGPNDATLTEDINLIPELGDSPFQSPPNIPRFTLMAEDYSSSDSNGSPALVFPTPRKDDTTPLAKKSKNAKNPSSCNSRPSASQPPPLKTCQDLNAAMPSIVSSTIGTFKELGSSNPIESSSKHGAGTIVHPEFSKLLVQPMNRDSYFDAPCVPGQPPPGAVPPDNITLIPSIFITPYDVHTAYERDMKEQATASVNNRMGNISYHGTECISHYPSQPATTQSGLFYTQHPVVHSPSGIHLPATHQFYPQPHPTSPITLTHFNNPLPLHQHPITPGRVDNHQCVGEREPGPFTPVQLQPHPFPPHPMVNHQQPLQEHHMQFDMKYSLPHHPSMALPPHTTYSSAGSTSASPMLPYHHQTMFAVNQPPPPSPHCVSGPDKLIPMPEKRLYHHQHLSHAPPPPPPPPPPLPPLASLQQHYPPAPIATSPVVTNIMMGNSGFIVPEVHTAPPPPPPRLSHPPRIDQSIAGGPFTFENSSNHLMASMVTVDHSRPSLQPYHQEDGTNNHLMAMT